MTTWHLPVTGAVLYASATVAGRVSVVKRRNGKWRARYRDPAGKEHARDFVKKLDATRWLAQVTTKVSVGDWVDPSLARVSVGEWAALWMASQVQLEPTTKVRYAGIVRNHIVPVWGRVQLAAVSRSGTSPTPRSPSSPMRAAPNPGRSGPSPTRACGGARWRRCGSGGCAWTDGSS